MSAHAHEMRLITCEFAGQDVYDMVKGADDDEGQLYIEGMDDAFMAWRRAHGAEWARYYGLSVRTQI